MHTTVSIYHGRYAYYVNITLNFFLELAQITSKFKQNKMVHQYHGKNYLIKIKKMASKFLDNHNIVYIIYYNHQRDPRKEILISYNRRILY